MRRANGPPDPDEFTNFYRTTYAHVVAYVQRRCQLDAEAIAADVYATAWVKYETSMSLGLPWLYRTAYLEIQNQRRAAATAAKPRPLPAPPASLDHADTAANHLWIRSLLQQLPHRDQELLRLLYWEDLDHEAVAIATRCRVGTVAVPAHRARKRLERLMAQQPSSTTRSTGQPNNSSPPPAQDTKRQTGVTRS